MKEYKNYKLNYYPKCEEHPTHDNRYQIFKARPYDDAEYYWAYTYDKKNWKVVFQRRIVERVIGTFEEVVDLIEDKNKYIKPKIIHW